MTTAADLSYAECVERLRAARDAAAALPSVLWQATGSELADGMEALGELSAVSEGAELALTIEAVDRGEPASARPPVTPREWVAGHHRRYAVVGASRVAAVAEACREPRHAVLREAVVSGRVSIGTARVAMSEMRLLRPHLRPDAVDSVWQGLVSLGERHDSRTVRQLRERLLAAHGLDGDFEDTEDRARRGQSLSTGKEVAPGLFEFLLRLSREGRATLEAAIGPLSAPTPADGEPDLRPHDQRRAAALVAVVGRAQKAGDSTWSSTKAQVFVAISLEDLRRRAGAGSLLGGLTTGDLATSETVRRWACDATIIPAVLGSAGEAVDLGRAQRLFTPAQIRRLWLRDRHCTYPGCDAPAAWCDAHHLVHWADGGRTDLDNAALLCRGTTRPFTLNVSTDRSSPKAADAPRSSGTAPLAPTTTPSSNRPDPLTDTTTQPESTGPDSPPATTDHPAGHDRAQDTSPKRYGARRLLPHRRMRCSKCSASAGLASGPPRAAERMPGTVKPRRTAGSCGSRRTSTSCGATGRCVTRGPRTTGETSHGFR